jgi:ubiquinone/menaquinone biosynthesis C-methylase UbiE
MTTFKQKIWQVFSRLKGASAKPIATPGVKADYTPEKEFHSWHYLKHNARRLEHLASLRIPVHGLSVFEVGAGIGDHSQYYLDRGCKITITESREENLASMRKRFPKGDVRFLDMEDPKLNTTERWDLVHCYGLLYHVSDPKQALEFLAKRCTKMMFLELCVSFGNHEAVNPVGEAKQYFSQATSGTGCRPTRPWVLSQLKRLFEYVYIPQTQPNHEEFPLDWTDPDGFRQHSGSLFGLSRAVFICSRTPIQNALLLTELPDKQVRAE